MEAKKHHPSHKAAGHVVSKQSRSASSSGVDRRRVMLMRGVIALVVAIAAICALAMCRSERASDLPDADSDAAASCRERTSSREVRKSLPPTAAKLEASKG
jgi:hypothetical protein